MPGNRPSGKGGSSSKGNIKRTSGNYKGKAASIGTASSVSKNISRSSALKPASSSPKVSSVKKNNTGNGNAKDGYRLERNINHSSKGSFSEKADISRTSIKEEANNIRNAMEDVGKKSNLSGSDRKGE